MRWIADKCVYLCSAVFYCVVVSFWQESSPLSLYFPRESLKLHSRTENSSKAAFLDHSETLWMRSAAAWWAPHTHHSINTHTHTQQVLRLLVLLCLRVKQVSAMSTFSISGGMVVSPGCSMKLPTQMKKVHKCGGTCNRDCLIICD